MERGKGDGIAEQVGQSDYMGSHTANGANITSVKASERAADAITEQELRHLFLTTVQVGECDPFHLSIPN